MAESDESGKSRAMPPPELNPLLNPTLNKHLSRWAEVYFKSPPETREAAVRELLRELEAGPQSLASASESSFQLEEQPLNGSGTSGTQVHNSQCQSCGFVTRPNQKFCGRCGARLSSHTSSETRSEHPWEDRTAPVSSSELSNRQHASNYDNTPPAYQENDDLWVGQEEDSRPLWYSYRFYIGTGLAALVLVLAYFAWQGAKTSPQSSKLPEQVPAAQAAPPERTPAPESPKANQPVTAGPSIQPASANQSSNAPQLQPQPVPPQAQSSPGPITTAVPAGGQPQGGLTPTTAHGTEELATARQFLDSAHPDNAQAAQWLWKSVEKQNTEATVLLGRLYLRGAGVQKNCEQGRVLLDAAAKKGNKEAASMVQNIQAFGCQ